MILTKHEEQQLRRTIALLKQIRADHEVDPDDERDPTYEAGNAQFALAAFIEAANEHDELEQLERIVG